METVRSIEASLPPEQTPTAQTINELKEELSQEFKLAANAVTKLYRIANEKNSILKHVGYIDCLNDIMKILDNNEINNLDELKKWCINEKINKLGKDNSILNTPISNGNNNNSDAIGINSVREINKPKLISPKFKLSKPPLSVEQSNETIQQIKSRGKWANNCSRNNNGSHNNNLNSSSNNNSNTSSINFVRHIKRQKKKL